MYYSRLRQPWCGLFLLVLVACASKESSPTGPHAAIDATTPAASDKRPIAPGKFIPTFAILYGGNKSQQTLKDAARFDLIDAGARAATDAGSWPMLKQMNPHLKVFVYEMGPGEYGTWGKFTDDQGWDWMTANHGLGSADRWTAVGTRGDYLQSTPEPLPIIGNVKWQRYWFEQIICPGLLNGKMRLMVIGNPNWQQYWIESMYNRFWSPTAPNREADGVFSDNTDYDWPWEGGWSRQGRPWEPDVPADYYPNRVYARNLWETQAKAFLDRAVTWLGDRHRLVLPNFGYMGKDPQSWHDLDSQPHPVFAAMEEGAFATPWGIKGHFTFYTEKQWLNQVNTMRHLKHVRALMLVHGPIESPHPDLARLNYTDVGGANRGSDILWFGLTSFLQGYDDVRQNAYLGFTLWAYGRAYWLDEFDPNHLNLGRAVGESHRLHAAGGHCYAREFDAGWAVVNPTDTLAKGVRVPKGKARVLDHYTFENPESQPLVTRFDLPAHRGVILLKEGRQIGNAVYASTGNSKVPTAN